MAVSVEEDELTSLLGDIKDFIPSDLERGETIATISLYFLFDKDARYMNQADIDYFIHFFNHSRSLTRQQALRRNRLLARDCASQYIEKNGSIPSHQNTRINHTPKITADFLSLFNNPEGLKFLTHDFDPDSELTYAQLVEHAQALLKRQSFLPASLYALMSAVLTGKDKNGKSITWLDVQGIKHSENYTTKSWKEWSEKNSGQHPLNNPDVAKEIMMFRSTIRLVKPALKDILDEIAEKHRSLELEFIKVEMADFYTNVRVLRDGLSRIFRDIESHSASTKKVIVEFDRKYDDEYSKKIIRITHCGSQASDFDDVKKKFEQNGGAFYSIKKDFAGYCKWSVEARWNGKPLRWNILDDTNAEEVESIESKEIKGFTHILTFYQK